MGNHDDHRDYRTDRARRKGADIDVLRQMVQFMAQRLMEIDVEGRCGAGYDEKSAERLNSRNVSVASRPH